MPHKQRKGSLIFIKSFMVILLLLPQVIYAQTTAELLGYDNEAKVLIINADDFGMCHAENTATIDLLQNNNITSATIMIPCPWIEEAASFCKANPQKDVGIHLTLTSEWDDYKWAGVAPSNTIPSLLTDEGYFPANSYIVEFSANEEEVETELWAQLERALELGIRPTHIDNHMASIYGLSTGRDFFDIVFRLSKEYELPFRLPRNITYPWDQMISPERQVELLAIADTKVSEGFVLPDYLKVLTNHGNSYEEAFNAYSELLKNLQSGVTELYIHAAVESDEIKAITNSWRTRDYDYRVFKSAEMKSLIDSLGIQLIGWSDLQVLQKEQIGTEITSDDYGSPPERFDLKQNYPNPFNPLTKINYELAITDYVELTIYNLLGQQVATLVSDNQSAGHHQITWDASDFSCGIYYYRIQTNDFIDIKKMILVK